MKRNFVGIYIYVAKESKLITCSSVVMWWILFQTFFFSTKNIRADRIWYSGPHQTWERYMNTYLEVDFQYNSLWIQQNKITRWIHIHLQIRTKLDSRVIFIYVIASKMNTSVNLIFIERQFYQDCGLWQDVMRSVPGFCHVSSTRALGCQNPGNKEMWYAGYTDDKLYVFSVHNKAVKEML